LVHGEFSHREIANSHLLTGFREDLKAAFERRAAVPIPCSV